jgi:N-formylglutamate amidohydrolase
MLKPGLKQEEESLSVLSPPFHLAKPAQWRAGLIFASPHSGNIYPQSFIDRSSLTIAQLRRNEDIFIDKLFGPVVAAGAPLLSARFPRCYVDVNRAENELPVEWAQGPTKPSVRAQAGLGVIPTHISEGVEIYRKPLETDIVDLRLRRLYRPYHNALQDLMTECLSRFGQTLLIDCHSMPGFSPMGARRPDIILGDRFGKACHPDTLARVQRIFRAAGYTVSTNYPYAGGFVTSHYGRPDSGIEALQIEINRDLYLNPVTLAPKRGYDRLAGDLAMIISEIIQQSIPDSRAAQ